RNACTNHVRHRRDELAASSARWRAPYTARAALRSPGGNPCVCLRQHCRRCARAGRVSLRAAVSAVFRMLRFRTLVGVYLALAGQTDSSDRRHRARRLMGLNYNDVRCLLEWRRGRSGGKVATLGRLALTLHPRDISNLRRELAGDSAALAW